MSDAVARKLMGNVFDKLHDQLSILRTHIEHSGDPQAEELLKNMECGLLAPMRKLRLHMNIPYQQSARHGKNRDC